MLTTLRSRILRRSFGLRTIKLYRVLGWGSPLPDACATEGVKTRFWPVLGITWAAVGIWARVARRPRLKQPRRRGGPTALRRLQNLLCCTGGDG